MYHQLPPISLRFAQLIIRYTHNLLREEEQVELNRLVEESSENLEVFEALTDGLESRIFSADELIVATDDLLDNWMIAGLVAREMEGVIGEDEKKALQSWMEESEEHEKLYTLFQDKANLQKFMRWMKRMSDEAGNAAMN